MAIQDLGTRDQYIATSGQTIFPYTFEIFDKNDVTVGQNGTALTEGTHYTVSGVGVDAGGNITLVTGAAAGDILTIYRDMALERLTDYQNSGDFLASDVNDDFDRVWAALQQNKNGADLAIRANTTDTALNSTNLTLASISTRANKALGFTSKGLLDYISGTMPVGTLRNYANMTALVTDIANTVIGDRVYLDERSTGNGGGAWWKVVDATTVTENGFDIVTGDATRSLQLIDSIPRRAASLGITTTGDQTAAFNRLCVLWDGKKVYFDEGVFELNHTTGTEAVTLPDNIELVGVKSKTEFKLMSAAGTCAMLGSTSAVSNFEVRKIILNGNKATVSAVNVDGIKLTEATAIRLKHCVIKNLKDLGSAVGGHGLYAANTTKIDGRVDVLNCDFIDIDTNAVQTIRTTQIKVDNCYGSGFVTSFTDIGGQVLSDVRTNQQQTNNTINCAAGFNLAHSVLSLLGDDVTCTGNKITGGGTQIVVHDQATTSSNLHNYNVSGNHLRDSLGAAIVINQHSATYPNNRNGNIVIANNNIYQPASDGIAVVGAYAGVGDPIGNLTIHDNAIVDNRTENPSPEAYACIRCIGATNVIIHDNPIVGPRWAGILLHGDGKNIKVHHNLIEGHQGRTNTGGGTSTPQAGGGIFVGGGTAAVGLIDIDIDNNTIENYGTQVSPVASYQRAGGIVVNEAKVVGVTINYNTIKNGNLDGICLLDSINVSGHNNNVEGAGTLPLKITTLGTGFDIAYLIDYPKWGTSRPTLLAEQKGFSMWDANLPKPIWWDGAAWRDSANAAV